MFSRIAFASGLCLAALAMPAAARAPQVVGVPPWVDTFGARPADLVTTGTSRYCILKPGYQLTLEGTEDGKTVRLVITVLDETKTIDGYETRVVEERESENGSLAEVSRNFVALEPRTGNVYYFGEDVDIFKNGKVVDHEGAWLHGQKGARFGLLLPGAPVVGMRYYQEVAPKVAMDRAEVMTVTDTIGTPAGRFRDCLRTEETTPLESGREAKVYAPGIGLVKDGPLVLVSFTQGK